MLGHKLNDYGLNKPNTQYKRKWNNKLNIFVEMSQNPYSKKYWKFYTYPISAFFKSIKYMFERAFYGYCDYDLCNLDLYYCRLIAASIHKFAKDTNSWNDQEYEEFKDWVEEIYNTAGKLDYALSEADDENEFWESYREQVLNKVIMDRHGITYPPNCEELQEQYHKRNAELTQEREDAMREAFEWITAHMHDLWN